MKDIYANGINSKKLWKTFHAVSKDYTCTKGQYKMTPAHGHLSTAVNMRLVRSRKQVCKSNYLIT